MANRMCLTKLHVCRRFLAFIIVKAIIIIFYKATRNAKLAFNPVTNDFLSFFGLEC